MGAYPRTPPATELIFEAAARSRMSARRHERTLARCQESGRFAQSSARPEGAASMRPFRCDSGFLVRCGSGFWTLERGRPRLPSFFAAGAFSPQLLT